MFDPVIDKILGSLVAVLTGVLVALAVKWLKKVGVNLEAEEQARLEHFVAQGINKAKEIAAVKASAAVNVSSEEKRIIATNHVLANVPSARPSQVASTITAMLPEMGEGASGKV
jgi:hypothetical protein